ncbi:MAG: hypothetical protein KDI19_10660 [Pseudomonadales bacterium]|nr:hypothetical protein [Pseudomonadales bacterium]
MDSLVDQIIALHGALDTAGLPHAFGGALALAWCTERARGTIDIDVNILIPTDQFERAIAAMPAGIKVTRKDRDLLKKEGQVRLWWNRTPVDLFLNTTGFHEGIAERIRWETFARHRIPFLSCLDLAVFKAFFNRPKDWVDLEEMLLAGTLDIERTMAVLIGYLGQDDERIGRLQALKT